MLQNINTHSALFSHLNAGAILITPNNRLREQLLEIWAQHHPQPVQAKPLILPYRNFLEYQYLAAKKMLSNVTFPWLLSAIQTEHLWSLLIDEFHENSRHQGLKEAIQTAWERCIEWQLSFDAPEFSVTTQTKQLKHYHAAFLKKLKELGAIPSTLIINTLLQHANIIPWKPLIWACFEDFTPSQIVLQKTIEELSISQWFYDLSPQSNVECSQYPADTQSDEIEQLIAWLKLRITAEDKSIAVVVPNLQKQARSLVRRLSQSISSSLLNCSMGKPLINYPLIADVFVFLTSDTKTYPELATIEQWSTFFRERLKTILCVENMDSNTYQTQMRWYKLLDEFLELGFMNLLYSKEKALSHLKFLAQKTLFQPKKSKAPIQILGLLEAQGCTFDSLWILQMTDNVLPQKTKLSAFIPIQYQRDLKMPYALASREEALAKNRLHRFMACAQKIVFSYPKLIEDIETLPSPLIQDLPFYPCTSLPPISDEKSLITYEELYQISFNDTTQTVGGTSILTYQAQCPFKAFAAHRLSLKEKTLPNIGISPILRGQFLHKIFEIFWSHLKNQENLLVYSDFELAQLIDDSMAEAFKLLQPQFPSHMLFASLEMERAKTIIKDALILEKQREPFYVEALEKEYQIILGGISLKVRIDRIDKTAANTSWIIDYKSSLPSTQPWYEERPQAPQLLIYALLDSSIDTLLFLQLKTGQLHVLGISDSSTKTLKGIQPLKKDIAWETQKNIWLDTLTNIAEEYQAGICMPAPNKPALCTTCSYSNLCRKQLT